MTYQQIIQNNPDLINFFVSANSNSTLIDIKKEQAVYPLMEWIMKDILNNDIRFKYSEYVSSSIFDTSRTVYNQKEQYILQEKSENTVGKEFSLRLINLYESIGKSLFSQLSVTDKILMSKTFGVIDMGPNIDIISVYKIIDG